MDDLRLYILFNSISVISGRCLDDNERLCAMEVCLWLRRFCFKQDRSWSTRSVGQFNPLSYRGSQCHGDIAICKFLRHLETKFGLLVRNIEMVSQSWCYLATPFFHMKSERCISVFMCVCLGGRWGSREQGIY